MNTATGVQIRSVLVATDFSAGSDAALHHALALARQLNSKIVLAHVQAPNSFAAAGVPAAGPDPAQQPRAQLKALVRSGIFEDTEPEVLVGTGATWDTLARMIQENSIDLMVLGTRGRTGLGKLLLGSVTEQALRSAPCPVLSVGPRLAETAGPRTQFQRIVFATDFGPESLTALPWAIYLARESQASLSLLHVIDFADGSPQYRGEVLRRLEELVPHGEGQGLQLQYAVETGTPAEGILKFANERGADLVVLGVHHLAPLAGHRPDTPAYHVVREALCPVLTVRG